MNNKKETSLNEKEIIEKFQKRERNISIVAGVVVFLVPLVFGILYFARYYELVSDGFIQLLAMILLIALVFVVLSRRCPNCGAFMNRYKVFPKKCHKCGAKLK